MLTVSQLINLLAEGIRKGDISSCSPVVMADGMDTFLIMDRQTDVVIITDVDPDGEAKLEAIHKHARGAGWGR